MNALAFSERALLFKVAPPPDSFTIRKITVAVNATELEAIFQKDAQRLEAHSALPFKQICFDGKTLYDSFSHTKDKRVAGVFSAFSAHSHLLLAYLPLEATKDHEILKMSLFKTHLLRSKLNFLLTFD